MGTMNPLAIDHQHHFHKVMAMGNDQAIDPIEPGHGNGGRRAKEIAT
jgi:hypothetical protein